MALGMLCDWCVVLLVTVVAEDILLLPALGAVCATNRCREGCSLGGPAGLAVGCMPSRFSLGEIDFAAHAANALRDAARPA